MAFTKTESSTMHTPTTGVSVYDAHVANWLYVEVPLSIPKTSRLITISSDSYSKGETNTLLADEEDTITASCTFKSNT